MTKIAVLCCLLAVAAGRPDSGYTAPSVGGFGGSGGIQGGGFGGGKGGNFGGGFGGGLGGSLVPRPYNFKYKVDDNYSGILAGHQEQREGYVTSGKYYVGLPDGRLQEVYYTADQSGFHPVVTYDGKEQVQSPAGGQKGGFKGQGGGFQGGLGAGFQTSIQQGY